MAECCFCQKFTDETIRGSLTFAVVAASRVNDPNVPAARYWCHASCLADRLGKGIPFDPEVFDE
jgi:hypothetical protein